MKTNIGFAEALDLTLTHVPSMSVETVSLEQAVGRILAKALVSRLSVPDQNVSRKDGYAVVAGDVAAATSDNPVVLEISGSVSAGSQQSTRLLPSRAMRITTGAVIPAGADAVIAEEFCERDSDRIVCREPIAPMQNILTAGADLTQGQRLLEKKVRINPAKVALAAASGISELQVYARPHVAVIATGDEIVAYTQPLARGCLYASNQVQIMASLRALGLSCEAHCVQDQEDQLQACFEKLDHVDAIVTTGGAWTSEKDLVLRVLTRVGFQGIYHKVRLGPGKGVGFGLLDDRPVFLLPGGPPSAEAAFVHLALPGIVAMTGERASACICLQARLEETLSGQQDWTQVLHACLRRTETGLCARPIRGSSRLVDMATSQAWIVIPEGIAVIEQGATIAVLVEQGGFISIN